MREIEVDGQDRAILLRLLDRAWNDTNELRVIHTRPGTDEENNLLAHQLRLERMMAVLR